MTTWDAWNVKSPIFLKPCAYDWHDWVGPHVLSAKNKRKIVVTSVYTLIFPLPIHQYILSN